MRTTVAVLFHIVLVPLLFAAQPRITFERLLPPAHLVAGEDVALVQAIGDHHSIETFVDVFADQVTKSRTLRLRDARGRTGSADAYLDVKAFTCTSIVREGELSARDVDNNKVRRKQLWVDAVCSARVDVLSNTMKRLSTYYVKGEGTSPRVLEIEDDHRNIALEQAARYAAVSAAERITPRRVRESILLDDTAPAFNEGMAMIDSGRLAEARTMWGSALRTHPRSAALRYNLAAVCEALGDRKAAEQLYIAARDLAPGDARYAAELKLFSKRTP
jgi:tetratricopeptide (TPR) repeat protein